MTFVLAKFPLCVCIGCIALAACSVLKNRPRKDDIWNFIKSKKGVVISFAIGLALLAIFCITSYFRNYKDRSYTLKYNYEEADNGLCPNGTWLNVSDTVGDVVIKKISERTGIPGERLQGCLELSSAMDGSVLNRKHPKIATDYSVSCTEKAYGLDTDLLIYAAGEAYQDYFMAHCAEQLVPLEVDFEGIENLEYQETADRLEIEAQKLKDFLSSYKWENQGYQDNTNFASIVQKLDDYINVELEKYRAYITENGVTKDSEDYVKTAEYKNVLLKKDYDKKMASYNVCLDAIDLYNSNMVSVVLVPTQDEENNFYMSRTKIGVDYFATDASSYSEQAASIKQEMDENSYAADKVKEGKANDIKKAQEMLGALENELREISEQSVDFFHEFLNTKRNGYIELVYRRVGFKQALCLQKNLMYALISTGCCIIFVLSRKEKRNDKAI